MGFICHLAIMWITENVHTNDSIFAKGAGNILQIQVSNPEAASLHVLKELKQECLGMDNLVEEVALRGEIQ